VNAQGSQREAPAAPDHPTLGIDLLEIQRLERALARRPRLADRLFTPGEREYAAGKARPAQHLAARFCAKEAVAKALGMTAWNFRDVEVVSDGGPPLVALHGSAAERAESLGVVVHVSLTHTDREAAAVALTERSPAPGS
jgi:holo-[acyl-carrier protein] synthase